MVVGTTSIVSFNLCLSIISTSIIIIIIIIIMHFGGL